MAKSKQVWGKRSQQFLAELQNQTVVVATVNETRLRGTLVGVDVYDLIIRQSSGLELLLPKGNVVYVHGVDLTGTNARSTRKE
jgi:hypothetical protein